MTIQALAKAIVDEVLRTLDHQTFAAIPEAELDSASAAVAQLLRDESASSVDPEGESLRVNVAPYRHQWTHVALVSHGVDVQAMYLNGVLAAQATESWGSMEEVQGGGIPECR